MMTEIGKAEAEAKMAENRAEACLKLEVRGIRGKRDVSRAIAEG